MLPVGVMFPPGLTWMKVTGALTALPVMSNVALVALSVPLTANSVVELFA